MADYMNPQGDIEDIRDLLSPYVDGEVSEEERTLVERAVARSEELRQELESLEQTVSFLEALPPMPAPRPFTLSETDVQLTASTALHKRKSSWFSGWLGGLAALATVIVCAAIAGAVYFNFGGVGDAATSQVAMAPQEESAATETAVEEAEVGIAAESAEESAQAQAQMAAPEPTQVQDEARVETMAEEDAVEEMAEEEAEAAAETIREAEEFAGETEAGASPPEVEQAEAEVSAEPAERAAKNLPSSADTTQNGYSQEEFAETTPLPAPSPVPPVSPEETLQAEAGAEAVVEEAGPADDQEQAAIAADEPPPPAEPQAEQEMALQADKGEITPTTAATALPTETPTLSATSTSLAQAVPVATPSPDSPSVTSVSPATGVTERVLPWLVGVGLLILLVALGVVVFVWVRSGSRDA